MLPAQTCPRHEGLLIVTATWTAESLSTFPSEVQGANVRSYSSHFFGRFGW